MKASCAGGYVFHRMSDETHRCVRCGRWAPGFAPPKEFVKPRAECQVCEKQQATDKDGTLGHHGYLRPGWGRIYNDCAGENHQPFPATDALEKWLKDLGRIERNLTARLADLEGGKPQEFAFEYAPSASRNRRETATITPGMGERYVKLQPGYGVTIPSYATMLKRAIVETQQQLNLIPAERKRVATRIAAGKALTAQEVTP